MSYIVKKKNRVLRIPEEKAEEYAKMGYEVTDENGEVVMNAVVTSVAEAQRAVNKLQKENEELKAAIQAQTTTGSAASVSEDSGKKKITKTSKQSE